MPPEMWTLPAELATVDHLLADPAILAPLVNRLDRIREVSDSFRRRKFWHFGVADA